LFFFISDTAEIVLIFHFVIVVIWTLNFCYCKLYCLAAYYHTLEIPNN